MISIRAVIRTCLGLVLAAGIAATANAQAPATGTQQDPGVDRSARRTMRGYGERRDSMMGPMHMLRDLDLSADQRTQVEGIFKNLGAQTQPLREEMRQFHGNGKGMDTTLSAEQQTRLRELRQELMAAHKQAMDSVLALLTNEQRAKMKQMHEQMRGQMKERMNGDRGFGPRRGGRMDGSMPPPPEPAPDAAPQKPDQD